MKDVLAFWNWVLTLVLCHLAGTVAALVAGVALFFGVSGLMYLLAQLAPSVEPWANLPIFGSMLVGCGVAYLLSVFKVWDWRTA